MPRHILTENDLASCSDALAACSLAAFASAAALTPAKKPFVEPVYDEATRTFRGRVEWAPSGLVETMSQLIDRVAPQKRRDARTLLPESSVNTLRNTRRAARA